MASEYTRLTGMFKTKNPKCFSGTIQGEGFDVLLKAIKEAKETDQAMIMYCFLNRPTDKVPMALTFKLGEAGQGRPRSSGGSQKSYSNRGGGQSRGGYQSSYKKKEEPIPMDEPLDDGFGEFGNDPGFTVNEF